VRASRTALVRVSCSRLAFPILASWFAACASLPPDARDVAPPAIGVAHAESRSSAEPPMSESTGLLPAELAPESRAPGQFVVKVVDYDRLVAKPGIYITAAVTGSQLLGDLDGNSVLFGPSTVFLPSMDPGVGFDVGMGFRTMEDAFEITYDRSEHTGSFGNMSLDSIQETVNFDWRHFFVPDRRLQPFTVFGFNIPWVTIENGAKNAFATGDATLYGFGMNLGGGAAYYLTPQLSINFQALMRLNDYFEVSALGRDGSISSSVFTEGWKLTLGTAFTF
jgi:hypothetical protein